MKKVLLIVLAVVVIICAGFGAYAVTKDNDNDYMPPRNLFNYFSTLYIWNEDKDSAPEGVRYALLENSETEIPLDEIFGKGTADLSELSETLRSVYDYGLKICEIYSYDGYKVPEGAAEQVINEYNTDRRINERPVCQRVYRLRDNSTNDMTISGFGIENDTKISEIFDRSGEEPIRSNENETYRLTSIIPSDRTKEFYTITISGLGCELNYKLIKEPAGSAQNAAAENEEVETKTIKLSSRQINALKRALDTSGFWNLETCSSYINYDDDTYIAEGVKDGKYHISCRQRAYAVDEKYYYVLCKAFMDMLPKDELGDAETTAYDPEKEDILYFWSADGSRSLESAMYSYFRKDADKPQPKLSDIYKNGSSDFEETISKVENGNGKIRVIQIYNPQNQKAEIDLEAEVFKKIKERQSPRYNSFSRIESRIIDNAPSVNIIQGIDIYRDNYYSSHLEKFGEGSIRDSEEEIYRCLYLPSMTNAYDIIKVTARKDGGELFYAKRDFDNNTATKMYDLTKEQVEGLKKAFKEADFWNTLVTEETLGTDGDDCVIEAVKNGRYHIMDRWAPDYNWHTRSGARECYELSEAFRRLVPIEDQYYFSGFSAGLQQKEIKKDALRKETYE